MSELSIFIDESGDFGPYDFRSPYYIITMVFHDQSVDISGPVAKLEQDLANRGFPDHCVHTGPIIRRENEYEFDTICKKVPVRLNHLTGTFQFGCFYSPFYSLYAASIRPFM